MPTVYSPQKPHIVPAEYAYTITGAFPENVITGFTKPSLEGDPTRDMDKALSFCSERSGIAYMQQVHGADIAIIDNPGRYICDGIFTGRKALALVVKTADCMPFVFSSRREGVIGAVHMGWRSAQEGILKNIPFDLSSFTVVAGVAMRRCCYEVGSEFLGYGALRPDLSARNGRHYFDPVNFARRSLMAKGLKEDNFIDLNICSYCSDRGFFSYRKTATSSRTLTFIAKI